MSKNIITCRVAITINERDCHGNMLCRDLCSIIEDEVYVEADDEECKAIYNYWVYTKSDIFRVDLVDVPDCEWLFHKVIDNYWKHFLRKCKNAGIDCYRDYFYEYIILLDNNLYIQPKVIVTSLDTPQLSLGLDDIPEHTEFKDLGNGNLELVRGGLDYPRRKCEFIDYTVLMRGNITPKHDTFPLDKIVKIGDYAFRGYDRDLIIDLPNCREVGKEAFNECMGLRSVRLPKLEQIHEAAFCGCFFLRDFLYPENIQSIEGMAFLGCLNLNPFIKQTDKGVEQINTLPKNTQVFSNAFVYSSLKHLSYNTFDNPYFLSMLLKGYDNDDETEEE